MSTVQQQIGSNTKYAPDDDLSQQHLVELDRIIGEIIDDEPEREIYITADHGMLEKTTALDPGRVLTEHSIPASSIPIIKDRYVAHHSNLGGAAYIFLEDQADTSQAIQRLLNTPGIEEAYSAEDAAQTFRLHRERIGDIFVLADKTTVFGELEVAVETDRSAFTRVRATKVMCRSLAITALGRLQILNITLMLEDYF